LQLIVTLTLHQEAALHEALHIVRATPGYAAVAVELSQLASEGQIHFNPDLEDRALVGLLGTLTLGPEALHGSPLSLAQTLVHEHFHLRQNPLLKTLSFWSGVLSGTHVMRRYEKPAYWAAHQFLEAVKQVRPELAAEAKFEQRAIRQVFASVFGGELD
jgi:hypothetical protein